MAKHNKVKWIVKDKNLIKFHDDTKSYPIAEGVEFDKVENGSDVEAEIKENIVVKIAVKDVKVDVKKDTKEVVEEKKETAPVTKKEEKKTSEVTDKVTEEKPAEQIVPVTWTVLAISYDNGVVKFEEQTSEKYWYPIASGALKLFKDLKKGDKIQIVIDKVDAESKSGETYQKDGVVQAKAVVKKEEPKATGKDVTPKKEAKQGIEERTRKVYNNTTNDSIERQVALKEAGAIIRSLIEQGAEATNTEEKINKLLSSFTKGSLEALRNA